MQARRLKSLDICFERMPSFADTSDTTLGVTGYFDRPLIFQVDSSPWVTANASPCRRRTIRRTPEQWDR